MIDVFGRHDITYISVFKYRERECYKTSLSCFIIPYYLYSKDRVTALGVGHTKYIVLDNYLNLDGLRRKSRPTCACRNV